MRFVSWYFAMLAIAGLAPAAARAESATNELVATSSWRIDYGAETCELARTFGTGSDAVTVYLRRSAPGHFFDLTVAGARLGKPRDAFGTKFRYGGLEERVFKDSGWIAATDVGGSALLLGRNTFAEWDKAAKDWVIPSSKELQSITKFEFEIPRTGSFSLKTGPMDKPIAALASCIEALVTHWGFDPTQLTAGKPATPINTPAKWISSGDYPAQMAREGQGALLDLRMVIAASGSVESCVVQNVVGNKAFAELACGTIMRRARFSPGLDASGKPVRSLYFNTAKFQVY